MNEKVKYEIYALTSIFIAVVGQLLMKWGMSSFGNGVSHDLLTFSEVMLNFYVIAGFICYIAAMFIWLVALKGLPLSYAFPLQSTGTILIFLFSWLLLKEDISVSRWIGFALIISGLILLTKNK